MTILEKLFGRTRVRAKETERLLVLEKGKLIGLHGPGEHMIMAKERDLEIVRFDIGAPIFNSVYEKPLFDRLPEVAARHLTVFRTEADEVGLIERDGVVYTTLAPNQKLVVWTETGPWAMTKFSVAEDLAVDPAIVRRLARAKRTELVTPVTVQDGQVGLVHVDGAYHGMLQPGLHGFWSVGKMVTVRAIELKRQPLDVTGQELLTRDKVTIRVNLTAEYRVTDPVKAVTEVKDYGDALYRALQHAFRAMLGTLTLDQILERKAAVTTEVAGQIREEMARIGLDVSTIELKDVILPGEMRDILNQVVAAEKQAEANVIRRREETNATRSLLNTAKVMAENPIMLRLKELEALESIAGKVERLTIHNGTGGLMNDLVRLRDQ
jgi:hypothetical protein